MNDDMGVFLCLCSMGAAFFWAWKNVAWRLTAKGCHRWLSHLAGMLAGWWAASGAFCLSGAFWKEGSLPLGVVGTLLLLPYLYLWHRNRASRKGRPAPETESSAQLIKTKDEDRRKAQEREQRAVEARAARKQALGMSFGDFYAERVFVHTVVWVIVCFLSLWVILDGSQFIGLIIGLVLTLILLPYLLLVPLPLFVLLALPSVACEAWWRIHHRQPYIPPPVICEPSPVEVHAPPAPRYEAPPPVRRSSGGWLIPLVLGLWIGSSWGGDD